jgi:hypothetical protein
MKSSCLADFYHGWLIEVAYQETGFYHTCYSPYRQQLQDSTAYPCEAKALKAAKQLIMHQLACYAMAGVLRDLYECGELRFDEWRSLNNSLN